jgi:bud site selection protein 31
MFYVYHRISREVYDYCIKNKMVDAALIAKWKKPGYEKLCSTYTINPRNYKFGTVSICRVPKHCRAAGAPIEDPTTGCRGCASGPGGESNIFGNKYGQDLAAIQIAREERNLSSAVSDSKKANSDDEDDEDEVVVTANGKAPKKSSIWNNDNDVNAFSNDHDNDSNDEDEVSESEEEEVEENDSHQAKKRKA